MKTIYYSIGYTSATNEYISLSLCENDAKTGCWTPFEENEAMRHSTYEDAFQNVTELQKIAYSSYFGSDYKLVFVDPTSVEWASLLERWTSYTTEICNVIIESQKIEPLYKRILNRVTGLLRLFQVYQ